MIFPKKFKNPELLAQNQNQVIFYTMQNDKVIFWLGFKFGQRIIKTQPIKTNKFLDKVNISLKNIQN